MMNTVTLGLYRAKNRAVYEQSALITGEPVQIVDLDEKRIRLLAPEESGDLSIYWLVVKTLLLQEKANLLAVLSDAEKEWRHEAFKEGNSARMVGALWVLAEKARTVRLDLGGTETE